jgi:phage terminase small subunit
MSKLTNPRHELFAQALATGKTADQAYKDAVYKPDRAHASRLAANGPIQARVDELLAPALEKAGVTVERIMAELARVAFSNITDIVSWRSGLVEETIPDEEGGGTRTVLKSAVTVLDSETLSADAVAAVAEVSQTDRGGIRVKMRDKLGALEKLGRHLGMFKDIVEHQGPIEVSTKAQRDAAVAAYDRTRLEEMYGLTDDELRAIILEGRHSNCGQKLRRLWVRPVLSKGPLTLSPINAI